MSEAEILGYIVLAVITLGSFVTVVFKFTQPVNDLRVVIQELRDCINSINKEKDRQNERLNAHAKQLDDITGRVGRLETKMDMYHPK